MLAAAVAGYEQVLITAAVLDDVPPELTAHTVQIDVGTIWMADEAAKPSGSIFGSRNSSVGRRGVERGRAVAPAPGSVDASSVPFGAGRDPAVASVTSSRI